MSPTNRNPANSAKPVDKNFKNISLDQMKSVVKALVEILPPKAIVLLQGDLGAGKTTLVRLIAEQQSVPDVQSPSFALHNLYKSESGFEIHHLDLYRIFENPAEMESIGVFDILAASQGWVFIEWGNLLNISDLQRFAPVFQLNISKNNQNPDTRDIEIKSTKN
jgi:tRNA threonylcarbamoyladenosine biosynthesis protein TsaE